MKLLVKSILLLFLVFAFGACRKTSSFTGKITNIADGSPISNAEVELGFYKTTHTGTSGLVVSQKSITNEKGEYALEIDAAGTEFGQIFVYKVNGYAQAQPIHVEPGDCGEENFELYPYDAWVSYTFFNSSNTEIIYKGWVESQFENVAISDGSGPINLQPGMSRTHLTQVPGGGEVTVSWQINQAPGVYKETVFAARNDTTFVTITL